MAHPRLNTMFVLVAILLAGVGCVSYFTPLNWPFRVRAGDWGVLHFYDGRARLFWIQSPEAPIIVEANEYGPDLSVKSIYDDEPLLPRGAVGPEPPRIDVRRMRVRIGNQRSASDFGGRWTWDPWTASNTSPPIQVNYVRFPVWLPVALLLLSPIRGVVRGPWVQRRRQRRHQCTHCGYSLKGLPEPRCPECGAAIDTLAAK